MDRRRFLLGSAAGAGLLAGCTGEQPRPAQTMPNGTENGSNTTENGTMGTETMDNGTTSTETANGTDSSGMGGETGVSEGAGLVTVESSQSFDATVGRIRSAIRNNDALTLMTTVDHAANAQSAGMQLPPTTLLIFGNPNLGTPLMQASRSTAIDLPQKTLVWEEEGQVYVTYNDPQYLAARHGIDGQEEILSTIANALESLATGSGG